jgi:hypothetical protein
MVDEEVLFWGKGYNWVARGLARRRMEAKIGTIISIANGHEATGQAPGSDVYRALLEEANRHVHEFADAWKVPVEKIYRQLPMLNHLRDLSTAVAPKPRSVYYALAGVAAVLTPMVFAFLHSIYQHAFYWLGGH